MLLVEFCEELFPEEDLILHQQAAGVSLRCGAHEQEPGGGPVHGQEDTAAPPHRPPGPPAFLPADGPAGCSAPAQPAEGDLVIPCEFCGVALEESVVFHHQRPGGNGGGVGVHGQHRFQRGREAAPRSTLPDTPQYPLLRLNHRTTYSRGEKERAESREKGGYAMFDHRAAHKERPLSPVVRDGAERTRAGRSAPGTEPEEQSAPGPDGAERTRDGAGGAERTRRRSRAHQGRSRAHQGRTEQSAPGSVVSLLSPAARRLITMSLERYSTLDEAALRAL
ncbi:hypothetical protein CRUP_035859, partial [Coryphaenoides rupestris]